MRVRVKVAETIDLVERVPDDVPRHALQVVAARGELVQKRRITMVEDGRNNVDDGHPIEVLIVKTSAVVFLGKYERIPLEQIPSAAFRLRAAACFASTR